MRKLRISECPECRAALRTSARCCDYCDLELRGDFDESPLLLLTREEQDFLLEFILVAGNLKALGERLDLSYPTLRSRLDRIIARLEALRLAPEEPESVLESIDRGELSPEAALQKLRKLITRKGEVA